MIDVILKTNGLDVRVLCKPSEDVEVNAAGKTLELITKLIDELWFYETVNISIKTREEQVYSNPPPVPHVPDELFKVHEDNMMRVYNEQRTTS